MKLPAQTYPLQSPAAPLFDLVVIGAGIAGLNALAAAADLLPKDARVALVDANARPGGMWTWIGLAVFMLMLALFVFVNVRAVGDVGDTVEPGASDEGNAS